jgi:hypothetical protein
MEASLISTDKLKKRGYIHGNVEDSLLRTLIIRVQDSIVEPIVGTPQFKRLIQGIQDSDLTALEITLMDNYIVPIMVAGCDWRSVNILTYELRNKGAVTASDVNFKPVTESENVRLKDDLKFDLDMYVNRAIGYLKDNCKLFPLYDEWTCKHEDIRPLKETSKGNISFL